MIDDAELDRCERMLTACVCDADYTMRGRTDPQCDACNLGAEVIDAWRAMRALWKAVADAPVGEVDSSGDEVRLIAEGSFIDNAVTSVRISAMHGQRVRLVPEASQQAGVDGHG